MTTETLIVGGKLYQRCGYCMNLVQINKPLLGALHLCLTDEERAAKDALRKGTP